MMRVLIDGRLLENAKENEEGVVFSLLNENSRGETRFDVLVRGEGTRLFRRLLKDTNVRIDGVLERRKDKLYIASQRCLVGKKL